MAQTDNKQNVEAIYPISSAQHAFLIHSLHPDQPDLGFLQNFFIFRGALNVEAFRQAWQEVMHRHPVLRTSIHWEDLEKPLQVVRQQVELPWKQEDWQQESEEIQQQLFAKFIQADKKAGISFSSPPLMRLTLIRLSPDLYRFIWTCHHILLDGWSEAIVFNEVLEIYKAQYEERRLSWEKAPPYRDYIVWLQRQDLSKTAEFWCQQLSGLSCPTILGQQGPVKRPRHNVYEYKEKHFTFSTEETQSLKHFARQSHLTMNTLLQGAWAILLNQYTDQADVTFGAAFSGRPPELPHIESMAGLFINTLPVRVKIIPDEYLLSWLGRLQSLLTEIQPHSYVSLAQIHSWINDAGLPGSRLFDTMIAFENYPWDKRIGAPGFEISDVSGSMATIYPLAIMFRQSPDLSLQMIFDERHFSSARTDRIVDDFRMLLQAFLSGNRPLSALLNGLMSEEAFPSPGQCNLELPDTSSKEAPLEDVNLHNPTEALLVGIWQDVLGFDHIDIHDNFFELGGHSLAVVQLFEKIEAVFGKSLPLTTLFNAPTPAQMVRLIQQSAWSPSWSSLVAIQPRGEKPPFFCTHPISGHNLRYPHLARYLGQDQPFYGLQSPAVHEEPIIYRTVEEMAALYVEEIRMFQPQGPYFLGGHSYGGIIAFEMAQQLQQQGQQVALLAMMDAPGPDYDHEITSDHYKQALSDRTFREQLSYVAGGLIRRLRYYANKLIEKLSFIWFDGIERPLSDDLRLARIIEFNTRALQAYQPQVYQGQVTVLRGESEDDNPTLGWMNWAMGGVDVHFVPGVHDDFMYEPGVLDVAAMLKKCLAEAQVNYPEASKKKVAFPLLKESRNNNPSRESA